ncbi:ATP-binding protein [Bacillus timonensis]|uniref:ATP-binding protein n=1 Tax=Bacillus timonensis TaxID=1033734 RepID=UPI001F5F5FC9|nr:ATP-binding protein [Bacillus timonensis]
MRRLFDKLFKDSSVEKEEPFALSLPSETAFNDLNQMSKKGFLAKKLCEYSGGDKAQGDFIFYLSFTKKSFHEPSSDKEVFIHLSERMVHWNEQNLDIPHEIRQLDIKNDVQNAMLKAYEMFKNELFVSLNTVKQTSSKQADDGKWEVYRDVILAATQGKFLLIKEDEVEGFKEGIVFCENTIKERSDIPNCRNQVKEILESKHINKTQVMSWLLVLSEAITNTIKHAEEGKMTFIEDTAKKEVRFIIEDKGPGFNLQELPKMALLEGYSTKKSMGQGFTLMMKMTKQVTLSTSPHGSTIILHFDLSNEKERKFNATG